MKRAPKWGSYCDILNKLAVLCLIFRRRDNPQIPRHMKARDYTTTNRDDMINFVVNTSL